MQAHDPRGIELSQEELSRYARHLSLPEIGVKGQKLLKASSVLCVGSGGLGSPVLLYLAAAGVGHLGIVDFDLVEDSNLQRQVLHRMSWLNKPKTDSARESIKEINPHCEVETFETLLNRDNALEIIQAFDIVCDCTDNFPSRYLINDACVILNKPNVYGSIANFEGQATVFNLDKESPNYRDLVPQPPPPGLLPSCAEGGVLGVLPGIIGLIQATEAIKIITGIGQPLNGRLLVFNALKMTFRELTLKQNMNKERIDGLIDYDDFCSANDSFGCNNKSSGIENISVQELKKILDDSPEKIILIDVRSDNEYLINSIKYSHLIPLNSIESGESIGRIKKMVSGKKLYVYCKSGQRSLKALAILNKNNIKGVNVSGGINAWTAESLS